MEFKKQGGVIFLAEGQSEAWQFMLKANELVDAQMVGKMCILLCEQIFEIQAEAKWPLCRQSMPCQELIH